MYGPSGYAHYPQQRELKTSPSDYNCRVLITRVLLPPTTTHDRDGAAAGTAER